MKNHRGGKNPFYGKRHTEETRRKMSEAAKRRWAGGWGRVKKSADGFRLLIAAIVRQAIKDGALDFFETETGRGYCDEIGINHALLLHDIQIRGVMPRRK